MSGVIFHLLVSRDVQRLCLRKRVVVRTLDMYEYVCALYIFPRTCCMPHNPEYARTGHKMRIVDIGRRSGSVISIAYRFFVVLHFLYLLHLWYLWFCVFCIFCICGICGIYGFVYSLYFWFSRNPISGPSPNWDVWESSTYGRLER